MSWNPRESYIELNAVDEAEAVGWWCRKVVWQGRRSAPDRVFAKGGRVVWIEFKRPGERPTVAQSREHDRMRAAGMEVYWCDDLNEARKILGLPIP